MNIIIVGFGRMGRGLTKKMLGNGHKVTVIDQAPEVFERPHSWISEIDKVVGIGFDRDVLLSAGIERADAVISLTTSDEVNALVARIAKNKFRVPKVIARSYDIKKSEIYSRLGIQTVSTTLWGVNWISEMVSIGNMDVVMSVGSGEVNLIRVEASSLVEGKTRRELSSIGEFEITTIKRDNKAVIPVDGMRVRKNDILYFTVMSSANENFKRMLNIKG